MKIFYSILLSTLLLQSCKLLNDPYKHKDLSSIVDKHKVIAVMPFKYTLSLRPKHKNKISNEELIKFQHDEGINFQHDFIKILNKRKVNQRMNVSFQKIEDTNDILEKNNISQSNMDEFTVKHLAKILKVDGIIKGTLETNQPMSEEASLALGVLLGTGRDLLNLGLGPTDIADCYIRIFDGASDELIWRRRKIVSKNWGSSPKSVSKFAMRKIARKLPY